MPWDEDPAEVVEGADEVTKQRQHGEAERYEEKPIRENNHVFIQIIP